MCCGTIFKGPYGEVVIDARYYTPCCRKCDNDNGDKAKKVPDVNDEVIGAMDEDFEDFSDLATKLVVDEEAAGDDDDDDDEPSSAASGHDDEGFFDKPAESPAAEELMESSRRVVATGT